VWIGVFEGHLGLDLAWLNNEYTRLEQCFKIDSILKHNSLFKLTLTLNDTCVCRHILSRPVHHQAVYSISDVLLRVWIWKPEVLTQDKPQHSERGLHDHAAQSWTDGLGRPSRCWSCYFSSKMLCTLERMVWLDGNPGGHVSCTCFTPGGVALRSSLREMRLRGGSGAIWRVIIWLA